MSSNIFHFNFLILFCTICVCVVADSTRKLYEKKLEVAMEKAAVVPSPDKTFYREEGRRLLSLLVQKACVPL